MIISFTTCYVLYVQGFQASVCSVTSLNLSPWPPLSLHNLFIFIHLVAMTNGPSGLHCQKLIIFSSSNDHLAAKFKMN